MKRASRALEAIARGVDAALFAALPRFVICATGRHEWGPVREYGARFFDERDPQASQCRHCNALAHWRA